jgi:hypothetical protein
MIMGGNMRTDWPQMFIELQQSGYNVQKISDTINVSRSTLRHMRDDGTEPAHSLGERFIQLWMVVTSKPREQIPEKWPDLAVKRAI